MTTANGHNLHDEASARIADLKARLAGSGTATRGTNEDRSPSSPEDAKKAAVAELTKLHKRTTDPKLRRKIERKIASLTGADVEGDGPAADDEAKSAVRALAEMQKAQGKATLRIEAQMAALTTTIQKLAAEHEASRAVVQETLSYLLDVITSPKGAPNVEENKAVANGKEEV